MMRTTLDQPRRLHNAYRSPPRRFNRKERFFLVGQALGKPTFQLDAQFRQRLGTELGLSIPEDAFVAMDYHLDWIIAAIHLAASSTQEGPYLRDVDLIKGNQEDVDLLVAYDSQEESHLIFIEAKGVTSFSNSQFVSKVKRLGAAFRVPEATGLKPHLALCSPRYPEKLNHADCPKWIRGDQGRVAWLPMDVPGDLLRVERCSPDERPSKEGSHWRVVPERGLTPVKL